MELRDFLNKEAPKEGGCMVCLAKYKIKDYNPDIQAFEYNPREEYMLVERHKCANGDMFTINKRFYMIMNSPGMNKHLGKFYTRRKYDHRQYRTNQGIHCQLW